MQLPQCADAVLMVRPAAFDYNPQTAASNRMQRRAALDASDARGRARAELDSVVSALRDAGIRVCVAEDSEEPPKPDAVFPNNWVSFHADGTVVIYPMQAENRRRERRREVIALVSDELGFRVRRTLDLTHHEAAGRHLEGTGSLVLDHANRIAYACRSPRTDAEVLTEWCREMDYEPMLFSACDRSGAPIYHTNVMLCLGERFAVVGIEAIAPEDRRRVLGRIEASGREIVEIGHEGIERFAGNVLELARRDAACAGQLGTPGGDARALGRAAMLSGGGTAARRVLVMSATARSAFDASTLSRLAACTDDVLTVELPTIERLGGGGVRCMLAEVFCAP